ncbi:MAG: hypothetical protein ACT4OT_06460 [Acidobacteriota bacterium]
MVEENLEDLRLHYYQLLKEHNPQTPEGELIKSADEVIIWMTVGATHGVIKKVSREVGLEKLSKTYSEVLKQSGDKKAVALIDLSIKLDHFRAFPEVETAKLAEILRKNAYASTILRDMVANHFYLFPRELRLVQRVSKPLGISLAGPELLVGRSQQVGLKAPKKKTRKHSARKKRKASRKK